LGRRDGSLVEGAIGLADETIGEAARRIVRQPMFDKREAYAFAITA
jgi:hypothetical protein